MNKKQRHIIYGFISVLIVFIAILSFVIFMDSDDLEWKKNFVFNSIIAFLFLNSYITPVVFFIFFTSEEYQEKHSDGTPLRITMFFTVIATFFIVFNIEEPIANFIDPNATVKREAKLKLEKIEQQQKFDSITFAQQLASYNQIQFEIQKISDKSQLCDYTEIQEYIDEIQNKLENQIESIRITKRAVKNHIEEKNNYLTYIDSLYAESNKIDQNITEIVYNETWYKKSKYLEYAIAFILGILSNLVFEFLRKRIKKS